MTRKKSDLINWIKSKDNYPYLFFLVIGLIIGTYKYNFIATIVGLLIVVIIGVVAGYIISKVIK